MEHRLVEDHNCEASKKSKHYKNEAEELKESIFSLLWDKEKKMFFDFDISKSQRRTSYPFASAGYALTGEIFDIDNKLEKEYLLDLVNFLDIHLIFSVKKLLFYLVPGL